VEVSLGTQFETAIDYLEISLKNPTFPIFFVFFIFTISEILFEKKSLLKLVVRNQGAIAY